VPELIGREPDLALLNDLWRGAQQGKGSLAVVTAEAGGGKTALLRAFTDTVQPPVLWGECADGEGGRPYWPWLNAFAAANVQPNLDVGSNEAARFELFQAAVSAIVALGPRVLVIDDLHWADGASLSFLDFFAPHVRGSSILLVVASRPEPRPAVQATLGNLLRRDATRLELRSLTPLEVRALVGEGSAELAMEASRRSAGNPLLATEYARHFSRGGDAGTPPASLAALVQAELQRLSPDARRLAQVCSLIEGAIVPGTVLPAANAQPEALEELFAASLLAKRTSNWRHDALREATRDSLPPRERESLEAALAEVCARQGDETGVAVHGCRAGTAWDPARAHAAALSQARRWAARYSLEFAEGFVELARTVRDLVNLDDEARLETLTFEGELLTQLHRDAEARTTLRDAAELAAAGAHPRALARIALSFGLGHEHGGARDVEVVSLLRKALAELPAAEHAERAKVLSRLAWQMLGTDEVPQRRQFAEAAVREARMAEDPSALATALLALCWGLCRPEDLAARRAAVDEATRAAEDAGDIDLQLGALFRQFMVTLELGDLPAARRAAADFDAITERCPLPYHRWNAYLFNSTLALIAGDLDRAEAFADQIDPPSTGQPQQAEVMLIALRGHINLHRGGVHAVRGARQLYEDLDSFGSGWVAHPRLAIDADFDSARDRLREAMERLLPAQIDEDRLAYLSLLAEAAVLAGAREECATLFAALQPFAGQWIVIANGAACRGPVASFLAATGPVAGFAEEAARFATLARQDISRNDAEGMLLWLELEPRAPRARSEASPGGLTPREAEVLALVARGHSNQEIADALVLSVRTVHRHVENVYGRLGVRNRAEATIRAIELGLVTPRDVREGRG
jgi:DNA-binding CsgD family transcriptional regulator